MATSTDDAVRMLNSAFPGTKFNKTPEGSISGGGVTLNSAEILGRTMLMICQIVAARLKAIETKREEDARKAAQ